MLVFLFDYLKDLVLYVLGTLYDDAFFLFASILVATLMAVYLDVEKLRKFMLRKPAWLIAGSVGVGTLTPLCACGTMAVVISLLSTSLPLGPIMAFLVSSPLMSPDAFILLAGIAGFPFALALTLSSIILGIAAGMLTSRIEQHSSFLAGQLRIQPPKQVNTICSSNVVTGYPEKNLWNQIKGKELMKSAYSLGIKKVLPLFIFFIMMAYLLTTLVPEQWVVNLFSGEKFYSVPLAALVGLPLYVSDASVAPLLEVLRQAGASEGSLLAFMITGPATSVGVIGGLNIILKRRAILLYSGLILCGSIILGIGYDLVNTYIHFS